MAEKWDRRPVKRLIQPCRWETVRTGPRLSSWRWSEVVKLILWISILTLLKATIDSLLLTCPSIFMPPACITHSPSTAMVKLRVWNCPPLHKSASSFLPVSCSPPLPSSTYSATPTLELLAHRPIFISLLAFALTAPSLQNALLRDFCFSLWLSILGLSSVRLPLTV